MKIFISTPGDSSVGIPGNDAIIEMEIPETADTDRENRLIVETQLKAAFGEMWCEQPRVIFEDQLPDFPEESA
jgi:hypothetical protein